MYPHERSLVAEYKDKPFAIIGVNSDRDKDKLQGRMAEEGITWRSFWDGGSTSGPISSRWNVQGWPTIYVIDHKGIIRAKNVRGKPLENWVRTLVAEASTKTAGATTR